MDIRFKIPLLGVHIGPFCVDGAEFDPTKPPNSAVRYESNIHAHISGPYIGWVCAKSLDHLDGDSLVHELAHLAAGSGHDDPWRNKVRRLGGVVTPAYRKRPRKRT